MVSQWTWKIVGDNHRIDNENLRIDNLDRQSTRRKQGSGTLWRKTHQPFRSTLAISVGEHLYSELESLYEETSTARRDVNATQWAAKMAGIRRSGSRNGEPNLRHFDRSQSCKV